MASTHLVAEAIIGVLSESLGSKIDTDLLFFNKGQILYLRFYTFAQSIQLALSLRYLFYVTKPLTYKTIRFPC